MLARVATFEFEDAATARSVLSTVRDAARDHVRAVPGWEGVVHLVDPGDGRATVIHFLADEQSVAAAEAAFAELDARFAEEAAGALAELRGAQRSVAIVDVVAREPAA